MAARSLSIVRYRPLRATPRVWARLTVHWTAGDERACGGELLDDAW